MTYKDVKPYSLKRQSFKITSSFSEFSCTFLQTVQTASYDSIWALFSSIRVINMWNSLPVDCTAFLPLPPFNRQLKRCVDKLSKSTYPSLAPLSGFVISGLQSVIYWKNFRHMWWVSYGMYVINCICTLMRAVFWHTCTFSGYISRLCRHTVESYCGSWIYCPIVCQLALGQVWGK